MFTYTFRSGPMPMRAFSTSPKHVTLEEGYDELSTCESHKSTLKIDARALVMTKPHTDPTTAPQPHRPLLLVSDLLCRRWSFWYAPPCCWQTTGPSPYPLDDDDLRSPPSTLAQPLASQTPRLHVPCRKEAHTYAPLQTAPALEERGGR